MILAFPFFSGHNLQCSLECRVRVFGGRRGLTSGSGEKSACSGCGGRAPAGSRAGTACPCTCTCPHTTAQHSRSCSTRRPCCGSAAWRRSTAAPRHTRPHPGRLACPQPRGTRPGNCTRSCPQCWCTRHHRPPELPGIRPRPVAQQSAQPILTRPGIVLTIAVKRVDWGLAGASVLCK